MADGSLGPANMFVMNYSSDGMVWSIARVTCTSLAAART